MDLTPLMERVASHGVSPEEKLLLQALMIELEQSYDEGGTKGVTKHIKKELDRMQAQAVTAIEELQERL